MPEIIATVKPTSDTVNIWVQLQKTMQSLHLSLSRDILPLLPLATILLAVVAKVAAMLDVGELARPEARVTVVAKLAIVGSFNV